MPSNGGNQRDTALNLMAKRLGLTYSGPASVMGKQGTVVSSLEGVHNQSAILNSRGGYAQQERMICDKRRTLDRALYYSYQGANVKNVKAEEDDLPVRALMNPNKVKQDYDDKIISIGYEHEFHPGDVFEWVGTNTYWLIYLQDLTELAYFRGDVRRCSYLIKWLDENNEVQSVYAAVTGPPETAINSITGASSSIDVPNLSLNILIPKTADTLKAFKRYFKFYIQNLDEGSNPVCWRVEAVDSISMPGVINFNAKEYYANPDTDEVGEIVGYKEMIEKEESKPEPVVSNIIGESFIKPKTTYTYTCSTPGTWQITGADKKKYPILIVYQTSTEIQLKWDKLYSGQFELSCGDSKKTIVVETLY